MCAYAHIFNVKKFRAVHNTTFENQLAALETFYRHVSLTRDSF